MSRFLGWGKRSSNASTQSLNALEEPHALDDALKASMHLMNDDVDAAEKALEKGNSAFHKVW